MQTEQITPRVPGGKLEWRQGQSGTWYAEHGACKYTIESRAGSAVLWVDQSSDYLRSVASAHDYQGRITPLMRIAEIYRELLEASQ